LAVRPVCSKRCLLEVQPLLYSEIIQQSVAPAFLLGAVASFVSVLNSKYNRIIDQRNSTTSDNLDKVRETRRNLLTARAALIHRATLLSLVSAALAAILIIASFGYAFFNVTEQRGLPALFTVSLIFLGFAFLDFSREVFASRSEFKD
jgi:hypothetical protein